MVTIRIKKLHGLGYDFIELQTLQDLIIQLECIQCDDIHDFELTDETLSFIDIKEI